MTRLPLPGCRPEPLLSYLKALGIFRLVVEQADDTTRAAWEDDVFALYTTLTEAELVAFFIHRYHPTPIVVPDLLPTSLMTKMPRSPKTLSSLSYKNPACTSALPPSL